MCHLVRRNLRWRIQGKSSNRPTVSSVYMRCSFLHLMLFDGPQLTTCFLCQPSCASRQLRRPYLHKTSDSALAKEGAWTHASSSALICKNQQTISTAKLHYPVTKLVPAKAGLGSARTIHDSRNMDAARPAKALGYVASRLLAATNPVYATCLHRCIFMPTRSRAQQQPPRPCWWQHLSHDN